VLPCHPQEVVDNIADLTHLGPIHGSTVDFFENEFDGHIAIQRQGGGHRTLAHEGTAFRTDTWYTGPGILQCRLQGDFKTHMLICHTPVEDGTTRAWHALMVQSKNTPPQDADIAAARAFQASSLAAFAQDFDVWLNKRPALTILRLPTDGPFGKARQWYRQFYNPRSEAKAISDRVRGIHTVPGTPGATEIQAAE
jgi:3-ketosteroid 9alpha-monooxygenase subunit A